MVVSLRSLIAAAQKKRAELVSEKSCPTLPQDPSAQETLPMDLSPAMRTFYGAPADKAAAFKETAKTAEEIEEERERHELLTAKTRRLDSFADPEVPIEVPEGDEETPKIEPKNLESVFDQEAGISNCWLIVFQERCFTNNEVMFGFVRFVFGLVRGRSYTDGTTGMEAGARC